ncbi:MAG TPA: APC family permease [Thermoleophilia bacterium]|nr:APC family permease [Thermoleophilia bacterium]
MATTAAKPEVFSRKASGLSRVMSPWSAFMYNFLTMGVIFPWTFVWAPAAFPGVSVWKACLLAILLELPIALAYVWMATAMPRSGGDYVFQSRVLGGAIGFPVVMSGFVIWILQWVALAGWLLATLGVAPLFMGLGVYYENQGLIDAAVWAQGSQGVVTISIIGAAAMMILLVTGFKNYVRLQYAMFAATGILVVILLVQFLRTTPAEFAVAMNHFSNVVDGRTDFYRWLQKDVADAGVNLLPAITFGAILLATPIVWTSLQWATYSVQQGGEIKGARVFKNQMFIIIGSMIAVGVVLALIAWAEERAVGTAFFNAVSHSYYYVVSASGDGIGSVLPFPGMFAIVISPNPIIVILVAVSFMLASLQITCNCYIGMTRIMVGMSLDRTLPTWFSKVSPRFRSPVNAHLIYFALGCVAILGYNYWTQWYSMTLGVTLACGYVFTISCLAAALLPFRAKALYEASPGAKYTLGGFPLVTIFGIIGFVFGLWALIMFLTNSAYGLTGTTPYIVVAGIFVVCLIGYWIGRAYNKGKGIDVNYAFLEVPPE